MRVSLAWFAALVISVSTTATVSADCRQDCYNQYVACQQECSQCNCSPDYDSCIYFCDGGDYDSDGFLDGEDNCPGTANPNQADCDNDGAGDVCDWQNGSFVPVGKWIGCASTITHSYYGYMSIEIRYQKQHVDVSACHSPDRWNHSRETGVCYGSCGNLKENTCASACWNTSTHSCNQQALCGHEFPELDGANIGTYFCEPDTL